MNAAPRLVDALPWPSDAELVLPGSKSEANRLLVAAALSGREVIVTGATPSDDVRHLVEGLAVLGFAARFEDERAGRVRVGPRRARAPASGELFCGNAGTALRFLVSVAAITPGDWTLTGDAHMQRRPVQPLVDAWQRLGVACEATNGCPPVRVRGGVQGGAPRGGAVAVDASLSSQFVSSLLLVGASLPDGLALSFDGPLASRAYAELTAALLRRFGVDAGIAAREARVRPGYGAVPAEVAVGADWSAMGVWTCLNWLTGSRVRAHGLQRGSGQADERLGDVLDAMPRRGAHAVDVAALPDQFLDLAVLAALREGETRLTGAANVRVKECDRVAVAARELRRLGADVDELPDGLVVRGGGPLCAATVDPEDDHRVAMAFALLGLSTPGVAIASPDCVAKSYPGFWQDVDRVRRELRPVAVVGMRGAGKSTFAAALAAAAGVACVDTDRQFEARHGPIAAFVQHHGWPAFRELEAALVRDAVRPGRVVATGGGAVEHEATRQRLGERALVVWLDGDAPLLSGRLGSAPERPSLTGRPVLDELADVLARRRPLYEALADVRLDAALPTAGQIDQALRRLRG